ncbi:hypothetical protein L917_19127, partial [Phytophthora nicotianae]
MALFGQSRLTSLLRSFVTYTPRARQSGVIPEINPLRTSGQCSPHSCGGCTLRTSFRCASMNLQMKNTEPNSDATTSKSQVRLATPSVSIVWLFRYAPPRPSASESTFGLHPMRSRRSVELLMWRRSCILRWL